MPVRAARMKHGLPVHHSNSAVKMKNNILFRIVTVLVVLGMGLTACMPSSQIPEMGVDGEETGLDLPTQAGTMPTPLPTREPYPPGTLVDYIAQTGDTLPALAARFNTTVEEIRTANTVIPDGASTMPPGFPMKIPIYYQAFWGSPYQIIPDSLFINGPAQVGFDVVAYVNSQPGWLKDYTGYIGDDNRKGGQLVEYVATNFSISPRLLLAILEYQTGALSNPEQPDGVSTYALGYRDQFHKGVGLQLVWASNTLNTAYYGWRTGRFTSFEHLDGQLERPDPWQNAASVSLQYYFSRIMRGNDYLYAISGEGLEKTYADLFGDPWENVQVHIPGSLYQPEMRLPFEGGKSWAYTGGPHTAWGEGDPLAAIDFAPPSVVGGCSESTEWVTAVADGVISRTGPAIAVLDLDGDGDERTGWVVFYLHLAAKELVLQGSQVKAGQPIGHPSCEGGKATGTHVHIARKFNGEWISADGPLAFNLEGWVAQNGSEPYQGSLTRFGRTVRACVCSDQASQIQSAIK